MGTRSSKELQRLGYMRGYMYQDSFPLLTARWSVPSTSFRNLTMWNWFPVDLQCVHFPNHHVDGFVEERRNSIANALKLCLPCTNPSMYLCLQLCSYSTCLTLWPCMYVEPYHGLIRHHRVTCRWRPLVIAGNTWRWILQKQRIVASPAFSVHRMLCQMWAQCHQT